MIQKKSILYVLAAGILWGFMGLFVRTLNAHGFYTMEITGLRSLVAMILMGMFLLVYDRSLFRIKWKDLWCFIGTGIISLTFFNMCYFKAITMTSLSVAAILLYTAPSIVMVLSVLIFHEHFTRRKVLSLFLAFAGCVLVTGVLSDKEAVISPLGIIIGLGSGLGYALYSIFARFALEKGYHSFTVTFYTLLTSALGTIFFLSPSKIALSVSSAPGIAIYILFLGFFSTCLPYILYTTGLEKLESSKASIIASIEPVTATLLGIFLFRESLTGMGLFGVLMVLSSIIIVNSPKR